MEMITDQGELDRRIQNREGFLRNAGETANSYKWHDLSRLKPEPGFCGSDLMTVSPPGGYPKHYAATEDDIPEHERSHRCSKCRR